MAKVTKEEDDKGNVEYFLETDSGERIPLLKTDRTGMTPALKAGVETHASRWGKVETGQGEIVWDKTTGEVVAWTAGRGVAIVAGDHIERAG